MTTRDAVKRVLLLAAYSPGDPQLYDKCEKILEEWRQSLKGAWSGD